MFLSVTAKYFVTLTTINVKGGGNMRLSKLQKWILEQAYRKTVLQDNTGLTFLDGLKDNGTLYWRYLFRQEVLLDYFNCKTNTARRPGLNSIHLFEGNNSKAQVILTRSINNLEEKNLIEVYNGSYTRWQGLILTEEGKNKALMLINSHSVAGC